MARKKSRKKASHYAPNAGYVKKTREKLGQSDWWTPDKKKKNHIRVMPAWDERGICIVRRVMHFGFEEDGRTRAFPCLEDNEPWLPSEPCPVDHMIKKMSKGDAEEREAAKELKPSSPRFLVQLVDCNDIEAGVQLWAAPYSFGKYFISLLEDEDIEDITDPEEGYDIYFEVSGSGRGTRYEYRLRAKPTPIPYDGWEDELQDLIETIEVREADELIALLEENYGGAFPVDEYLEDFYGGKKKKKKKKSSRKKQEEEEEQEEREEEEEEEEYEYEDIMSMKKRKLLKLVKDEELPISDDDWSSVKELRELVAEELGLEEEED